MKISIYEGCIATNISVEGNDIYSLSKSEIENILISLILKSDITEESNKYNLISAIQSIITENGKSESNYCETCGSYTYYSEIEI